MTADDARAMLDAGASLVQLYTGLVYAGPGLLGESVRAVGAARDVGGPPRATGGRQ
jgi:dihydroorotate dehydrogenase